MIRFITTLCVLALAQNCQAPLGLAKDIKVIYSLAEIDRSNFVKGTLLLLDLDENMIIDHEHTQSKYRHLVDHGKHRWIEDNIVDIVHKLKNAVGDQQFVTILGLTKRSLRRTGTLNQGHVHAKEKGLPFSRARFAHRNGKSLCGDDRAGFQDGIIYTAGHHKGNYLKCFLNSVDFKPNLVVMSDDIRKNLLDVQEYIDELKLPFHAYEMRGAENLLKGLPKKAVTTVAKVDVEKVLTYNVSWEAMTNSPNGTAGTLGKLCVKDYKLPFTPTICAKNVAATIDRSSQYYQAQKDFDFVALQEAANWQHLVELSTSLRKMTAAPSGGLVSFYNGQKFHLLQEIHGTFEGGRYFHILIFKEKVIFVNLHNGHRYNAERMETALSTALKNKYQGTASAELQDFRIVIAGDFNDHKSQIFRDMLKPGFVPFREAGVMTQVNWRGGERPGTCCSTKIPFDRHAANLPGDYILDSELFDPAAQNYRLKVPTQYDFQLPQSDHLPVVYVTW